MAFQYKTLITLAPAALLIMAFQNCAPQAFSQTSAASEKSFAVDGTADVPIDEPADASTDVPHDGVSTPDQKRAANCKELRAKFVAMKLKAAYIPKISVSGKAEAGPFYISGADEITSSGQSDVYVVGSDANAMAKKVSSSGQGHVVLCGVYGGDPTASGEGVVDIIGANVLGKPKSSGNGEIKIFDQDGNKL